MSIRIVPITEEHVDSYHACLDAVATERRYLALLHAPAIEATRAFVQHNIATGEIQLVALDGSEVVGWCDIVSRPMEGFEHVGALGMGLDAFRLRSQGTIRLFPIAHPTAGPMSPQALQQRFRQIGQSLTAEEWALLGQLWKQDGLSRQVLAAKTFKDQTTVTRLLDGLVTKGVIRRETDATDRRVIRIWLTDAGRQLESDLVPVARGMLQDAVRNISEADLQITLQTLRQIQANLLRSAE
jgi:DNA-binding MarR family transcriptional regulator